MIATSLVVWPAAPLFLFMHGKDINVAKGTPITAFVEGDCTIDAKAWQRYNNPTPVSARVAAPVPNVQPVGPAPIAAQSSVYGVVVTPGAETESVADAARRYRAEKAKQQDNGGQQ